MRSVSLDSKEASLLLKDSLKQEQVVSLTVKGNSMFPLFVNSETIVHISPLIKPLLKYDVVLISQNEQLILHRVIKLNPLITRGDALRKNESIQVENVLGIIDKYEFKGATYRIKSFGWRFKLYSSRILLYIRLVIRKVKRGSL